MVTEPGLAERGPIAVEVVATASGSGGLTVAVVLRGAGVCALLHAAPGPQPLVQRPALVVKERTAG